MKTFTTSIIMVMLSLITSCGKFVFPGAAGPAGAPGTTVTVVQLCQSCVPVYPSTFSEVAFCINGNLYGTYSANDGFSAELPPGAYSSDGINCSCSFVIGPNCQVST